MGVPEQKTIRILKLEDIKHIPYSSYPRMYVEYTCIGMPRKWLDLKVISSCERIENISKRKTKWKCNFLLSLN